MVQGKPIIRIRIRTTIIRIRTTYPRILRIIRTHTGEEFPKPRKPFCYFQYFNLCQRRHTLLKKTPRNAPIIQGTRETQNSYSYSHHDNSHAHHAPPHSPHHANSHRRGVDTSHQAHYHLLLSASKNGHNNSCCLLLL